MGYLTPDLTPSSVTCRALFIPNDEQYLAIVRGALQALTFDYNWTKYGALSPEQSAANFVDMFDRFCLSKETCRVIGEIIAFAGATIPDARWLACDGSQVLITDYPDLYVVIGSTYGSADSGYFRLPDLRGRSIAGIGAGTGLDPVTLAQQYGEQDHTLTESEIPSHVHAYDPVVIGDLDIEGPGAPQPNAAQIIPAITENTYATGGGESHNNVGPRLGLQYLIWAKDNL